MACIQASECYICGCVCPVKEGIKIPTRGSDFKSACCPGHEVMTQTRIDNDQCVFCASPLSDPSMMTCDKCIDRARTSVRLNRAKYSFKMCGATFYYS